MKIQQLEPGEAIADAIIVADFDEVARRNSCPLYPLLGISTCKPRH